MKAFNNAIKNPKASSLSTGRDLKTMTVDSSSLDGGLDRTFGWWKPKMTFTVTVAESKDDGQPSREQRNNSSNYVRREFKQDLTDSLGNDKVSTDGKFNQNLNNKDLLHNMGDGDFNQ